MAVKPFKGEIWKPIPGTNSLYWISSHGRALVRACVRTLTSHTRNHKEKLVGTHPTVGYPSLTMCHPQTHEKRIEKIHVLVAEAFIGPRPSPRHEVNHKDGVKTNCHVSNLEWTTFSENNSHAYEIGLKPRMVLELNGESHTVKEWSNKIGMPQKLIYSRLKKGYPVKDALDVRRNYAGKIFSRGKP